MECSPQNVADKGSKKWIQKIINEESGLLNSEIRDNLGLSKDEDIEWLSPLKCDKYAEYFDQGFLNSLCIELKRVPLVDFWPKGGPHWDALGRSSSGKLFLVEAKSHIPELISTTRAEKEVSLEKICKSLKKTKRFLNSNTKTDWCSPFYQYTNRLAHLYLLRELNQLPAYLVFVYFINDFEMNGPTTVDEWKGAIKLLHLYLGIGKHKLQNSIADIFIDVTCLK